jgi:two-component system nitrogen regulation sensor histidine kinase GlnL
VRIALWNSANIYSEDGKTLLATIAQGQDITERIKAEEVLKRDKDSIEKLVVQRTAELINAHVELDRSKRLSDIGTLAAAVAHELRNPLGVIRTAVYNIRRKNQNNNLDSHLANIEKKISESNQIINNLLDYSRIKTPQLENTSIYSVLEECIGFEKEKYASKNIGFLTRLDAISDIHLQIDPLQIRQVFSNIIDNACQAIEKEKGVLEVSATLDEGKQNVIISFKDNGIGIEKEDIARLFEPFFTRKSKGTGLGLTICNELIKLHNGKITIESVPGEGTSVLVALPGEGLKRNE